jgi:DNA-directed RNA polymerase alpha subunit
MAKVNNIKHSKDKFNISFNFDVNDGDLSLANSLRRILLSEVETYAFDEIKVKKNTSVMNDDFLKSRIELIPIKYDYKNELDELEFNLNVKNDIPNRKIFSKDLISNDKKIYFDQDILLNSLKENEELIFEAKLKKGKPKIHAKWSQIFHMGFKFKEDEQKNKSIVKKDGKINKSFPNEKQRNYLLNKFNNPSTVLFELESNENIDVKSYVNKGIEVFIEKLNFIKDSIKNENKSKIVIIEYIPIKNTYDYHINDETHTIGNLFMNYCGLHKNILSSSYQEVSNINTNIVLRLISNGNETSTKILNFTIEKIINNLLDIKKNFN